MRTIKFRGKRTDNGEWVSGDILHCEKNFRKYIEILHWQEEPFKNEVITDSVGQYTGINDALDHEIYEGDIVKIDGCPEKGYLIVVFYEGSFALATPKEYACLQQGAHPYFNDYARLTDLGIFDYQGLYRVLGNITDNPELIKEG